MHVCVCVCVYSYICRLHWDAIGEQKSLNNSMRDAPTVDERGKSFMVSARKLGPWSFFGVSQKRIRLIGNKASIAYYLLVNLFNPFVICFFNSEDRLLVNPFCSCGEKLLFPVILCPKWLNILLKSSQYKTMFTNTEGILQYRRSCYEFHLQLLRCPSSVTHTSLL